MQPVGRLSGRLRRTSEESHTGSEPLWSGWRQKDRLLWPCCQSTGRGREECLFIFPWEPYILCIARRTGFCRLRLCTQFGVECAVHSWWRNRRVKSPQEPHTVLWASLLGYVRFPPRPCPPGMQANIDGGERWAQGICFSGFLSFFLHMFYPSPPGRDCF